MSEFVGTKYLHPKTQTEDSSTPSIHQDAIAMMSAGVFSSAIYTHILRSYFKLEPEIAFGYSMGESASMWYSLNVWSPSRTSMTHACASVFESRHRYLCITPIYPSR